MTISAFEQSLEMTGTLWMIFLLLPVCNYAGYIRCIPPHEQKIKRVPYELRDETNVDSQMRPTEEEQAFTEEPAPSEEDPTEEGPADEVPTLVPTKKTKLKSSRQRTFIRNPNYKSANKKFDEQSKDMYITWLPKPHPGALPGSTNGCLKFEVIND